MFWLRNSDKKESKSKEDKSNIYDVNSPPSEFLTEKNVEKFEINMKTRSDPVPIISSTPSDTSKISSTPICSMPSPLFTIMPQNMALFDEYNNSTILYKTNGSQTDEISCHKCDNLKDKVEESTNRYEELMMTADKYKSLSMQLEKDLGYNNDQMVRLEKKIIELEERTTDDKEIRQKFQNIKDEYDILKDKYEKDLESRNGKIIELEKIIEEKIRDDSELKEKFNNIGQEYNVLKEKYDTLVIDNEINDNEIKNNREEIFRLDEEKDRLESELDQIYEVLSKTEKKYEEIAKKYEDVYNDLEKILYDLNWTNEQRVELYRKNSNLIYIISEKDEEINKMKEMNQDFEQKIDKLNYVIAEKDDFSYIVTQKDEEINNMKEINKDLEQKIDKLTYMIGEKDEEMKELHMLREINDMKEKELSEMSKTIDNVNQDILDKNEIIDELKSDIDYKNLLIGTFNKTYNDIINELDTVKVKLNTSEGICQAKSNEIIEMKREFNELAVETENMKKELKTKNNFLNNINEQKRKIANQKRDIKIEKDKLKRQIENFKQEKEDFEMEKHMYMSELNTIKEINMEINRKMIEEKEELEKKKKINYTCHTCCTIRDNDDKYKNTIEYLEKRVLELEKENKEIKEKIQIKEIDSVSKLNRALRCHMPVPFHPIHSDSYLN